MVTLGTFDGVHRGHLDIVERLVRRASERSLPGIAVTFDRHPLAVVRPDAVPPLLTTDAEKLEVLAATGLDYLAVLHFTPALAQLDAERFVREVLLERYRMRELFIGHDHGFGRDRAGNAAVLRRLGERLGFSVEVVEPVDDGAGHNVSSTAIRAAVRAGDLPTAELLLGRPYCVSGTVLPGEQRGRQLGYPTLNVEPPPGKLLPPDGVYAVRVQTAQGCYGGMMNLGGRPTFGDFRRLAEAYLFDAAGDLYGQHVRIDFVRRIRDIARFANPQDLAAQIRRDEIDARSALTGASATGNLKG